MKMQLVYYIMENEIETKVNLIDALDKAVNLGLKRHEALAILHDHNDGLIDQGNIKIWAEEA